MGGVFIMEPTKKYKIHKKNPPAREKISPAPLDDSGVFRYNNSEGYL